MRGTLSDSRAEPSGALHLERLDCSPGIGVQPPTRAILRAGQSQLHYRLFLVANLGANEPAMFRFQLLSVIVLRLQNKHDRPDSKLSPTVNTAGDVGSASYQIKMQTSEVTNAGLTANCC